MIITFKCDETLFNHFGGQNYTFFQEAIARFLSYAPRRLVFMIPFGQVRHKR